MKDALLAGAVSIGRDLLNQMSQRGDRACWSTLTPNPNGTLSRRVTRDVYTGGAGITLFLIELYRATGDDQWRKAIEAALDGLVQQAAETDPQSLSWFTGLLSMTRPFLRMAQIDGGGPYLDQARQLLQPLLSNPQDIEVDDLLIGRAGTLLGLAHLHAALDRPQLLELIQDQLDRLTRRVCWGERGLSWGRNPAEMKPLCGFSHGASGVAFALIELGRYLNLPACFRLADLAFDYEDRHLDPQKGWPDFRKPLYTPADQETLLRQYRAGNLTPMLQPVYSNVWCHGAPGIALSRYRAWRVTGDPKRHREYQTALSHCVRGLTVKPQGNLTLCHGVCGNWEPFLVGGIDAPEITTGACQILAMIQAGQPFVSGYPGGEASDSSLFMGNAGIGYALLRLRDPDGTPSVLAPQLDAAPCRSTENPPCFVDLAGLYRQLTAQAAPRTSALAARLAPQRVIDFFQTKPDAFVAAETPAQLVQAVIEAQPDSAERLKDILKLETRRLTLATQAPSLVLTFIREKDQQDRMAEGFNPNLPLALSPEVVIVVTAWDWALPLDQILETESAEYHVVLLHQTAGVREIPLDEFSRQLIQSFHSPRSAVEVTQNLLSQFDLSGPEEAAQAEALILEHIKDAAKTGVLTFANP